MKTSLLPLLIVALLPGTPASCAVEDKPATQATAPSAPDATGNAVRPEIIAAFAKLHNDHLQAFVTADGFGNARMYTAPMQEYTLRTVAVRTPKTATLQAELAGKSGKGESRWNAAQGLRMSYENYQRELFNLVGLLHYAHPVAYDLKSLISPLSPGGELPRGSALRGSRPAANAAGHNPYGNEPGRPVRDLNGFETEALARLKAGEDVVIKPLGDSFNVAIKSLGGSFRMLGAVRAQKSCLECHEDKHEGDLLGAFSYLLVPSSRQ
ncbi:MAG: hypothetical protein WCL04_08600 [Verrucomicrobiota bacterium]